MTSNWRRQQKAQLRQRLYDVALELFRGQGYEATTVQQITERAGVGKGTFFNHFPSKEHVVVEWYDGITRESLAEVRERAFGSAEEAVSALVDATAVRAAAAPELVAIKARIAPASDLLAAAERTQDAEMFAFCIEQLRAGKRGGELAAALDEGFFAELLVAMLTGTSRGWVAARHGFDLREVLRRRIAFLFRAARSPEPSGG